MTTHEFVLLSWACLATWEAILSLQACEEASWFSSPPTPGCNLLGRVGVPLAGPSSRTQGCAPLRRPPPLGVLASLVSDQQASVEQGGTCSSWRWSPHAWCLSAWPAPPWPKMYLQGQQLRGGPWLPPSPTLQAFTSHPSAGCGEAQAPWAEGWGGSHLGHSKGSLRGTVPGRGLGSACPGEEMSPWENAGRRRGAAPAFGVARPGCLPGGPSRPHGHRAREASGNQGTSSAPP